MTNVRQSDVMQATQQASNMPPARQGTRTVSFGQTAPKSALARPGNARQSSAHQTSYTSVRPTAAQADTTTRWQRLKQTIVRCFNAPKPQGPAACAAVAPGDWVVCRPAVRLGDIDGLCPGYQVRTQDGMDMIYGVPMPGAAEQDLQVTCYRDLGRVP